MKGLWLFFPEGASITAPQGLGSGKAGKGAVHTHKGVLASKGSNILPFSRKWLTLDAVISSKADIKSHMRFRSHLKSGCVEDYEHGECWGKGKGLPFISGSSMGVPQPHTDPYRATWEIYGGPPQPRTNPYRATWETYWGPHSPSTGVPHLPRHAPAHTGPPGSSSSHPPAHTHQTMDHGLFSHFEQSSTLCSLRRSSDLDHP